MPEPSSPTLRPRRLPRAVLAFGAALGALVAVAVSPALGQQPLSDRELAARRQQVFESPALQADLPGYEDFCRKERSVARGGAVEKTPGERERASEWSLPLPASPAGIGAVAQIFQWLLLALGAVALVLAVGWLIQQLYLDRRPAAATPQVQAREESAQSAKPAREPSENDLDALLQRRDFGAAIHLLLLRAVRLLARRGSRRIPAGHTSREVLAGTPLEPPARSALGELVTAVERSLFGGRTLGADDFARCREAFATLERSLRGEPAGETP